MHAKRILERLHNEVNELNECCNKTTNCLQIFFNNQLALLSVEIKHILTCLNTLCKNTSPTLIDNGSVKVNSLKWTGDKVEIVELIYALYYSGRINYGEATLKQIAKIFAINFSVDLEELYRIYTGIKDRKCNPARFMDELLKKFNIELEHERQ